MKLPIALSLAIACLLLSPALFAQKDHGITFFNVKPPDFSMANLQVDTSNGAVIIADVGKSYFEGNSKGWFSLVFEHKRRVRIIDKKGFDLASVSIPLYFSKNGESEERLESLKGITYNLEDGKVVESKLDKDNVFKEKSDDFHNVKKFTMPAVREGSIIEYSYIIRSDYLFNLQPWVFQDEYPRAWSEYQVTIPAFFKYVVLNQGYFPFHIKSNEEYQGHYTVRQQNNGVVEGTGFSKRDDIYEIPTSNKISKWVIKDVPAMKEEKFTSSVRNHLTRVEFQLAAYNFPGAPYKPVMGSWETLSMELLRDKDFGAELSASNNWMENDLKTVAQNTADKKAEAVAIYNYVKTNFKNKGNKGIYLSQPLKQTFKNKFGHVSDLNLLLTAMLMNRGFNSVPVILSTRAHGATNSIYPLINQYNYVISKLTIGTEAFLLDASQPYLGFNKLPVYCYNGAARVISSGTPIELLEADSISEDNYTSILLNADPANPLSWKGIVMSTVGYNESSNIRNSILEKGKDQYIKQVQDSYAGDIVAEDVQLSLLDKCDGPVKVQYALKIANNKSDVLYFSPMLNEGMKENVFKSSDRQYPVEMPSRINENYELRLEIPEGYAIDELPKSARVTFNENEALFEYLISKTEKEITLKTVLRFNRANFLKDDYESLRGFFDYIVKKHAEQIVFKKK
jgi:hypothetical protein